MITLGRCIVIRAYKEHPNIICKGWQKLCEERKISYTYGGCDCSMMERRYQILQDGEWINVYNCPYCDKPINKIIWKAVKPVKVTIIEPEEPEYE